jgi:multiple sugar transport system permease protein
MPHTNPSEKQAQRLKYAFIVPALFLLIALNIFPLLYNIVLSFSNAELSGGDWQFIGGDHFTTVFSEPKFVTAIQTTSLFVFAAVSIELVLGFTLALTLNGVFRGKSILLTLLLLPMMLSPAVMGLYWNLILNGHYGILNQSLTFLHIGQPQWLTDPDLKLLSILIVDVWMWTPFMMLIALAGLQAIPSYLYEAAEIDRASRWTIFRRITLPLTTPLLFLAVLFRTTDALKQFDLVMAMTGPNDRATQTLSALLYQIMLRDYNIGLGSAYALVILVMVIALASMFIRYIDAIQRRQGRTAP